MKLGTSLLYLYNAKTMNRLNFIFFCTLYVSISILSFSGGVDAKVQLTICMLLIALVGIPHGAIDHILYLKMSDVKPAIFYSSYFVLMGSYLACWLILPVHSMVFFIFLSAYHFGESQLNTLHPKGKLISKLQFLAWGTSILSGLVVYNHGELVTLFSHTPDLRLLLAAFPLRVYKLLLVASTTSILTLLFIRYTKDSHSREAIVKELYSLALVHIAFFLLPLLPGFTVYFVVLHSGGVLVDEFIFLKSKVNGLTASGFVKKLIPYTLVSLVGGIILFVLIRFQFLQISYVFLAIILISILTLPHSMVMSRFYKTEI